MNALINSVFVTNGNNGYWIIYFGFWVGLQLNEMLRREWEWEW